MTSLRRPALAFGITLLMATAQSATAQTPGTAMPRLAAQDPIANEGVIEDGAIEAIKEMSNYLMAANDAGADIAGKPGRGYQRWPAHPDGRRNDLQDPSAGLCHRL